MCAKNRFLCQMLLCALLSVDLKKNFCCKLNHILFPLIYFGKSTNIIDAAHAKNKDLGDKQKSNELCVWGVRILSMPRLNCCHKQQQM